MQHRIGLQELRERHTALDAATQQAPCRLGRYDVVGTLGSGGMGTVYDAVDADSGARVALKTLYIADKAALGAIKHEFRKAADLAHPNLVPVYELAEDDGLWFFTMERIRGVDFTTWARGAASPERMSIRLPVTRTVSSLHREQVDSEGETVDVGPGWLPSGDASLPERPDDQIRAALLSLVEGIQALHDAGLTHGDIKPENTLVTDDGRVVIVDFGLTRSAAENAVTTAGTPRYMAPEITGGGATRDRADWFSVGVMLYESLTGVSPFAGGSVLDMFLRKMRRAAQHPRTLLPSLPQDLCDLAMAFLHPNPEERAIGTDALAVLAGKRAHDELELRTAGFVGRVAELTALECAYGMARLGVGSVVHLRGSSGIGKSALAQAFLDGVGRVDAARSLCGRCYERESIPYKAFDGVMDGVAAWLSEIEDFGSLRLPEWMPEVAQAFPVLAGVPGLTDLPEPAPADAMELRRRVRSGVASLLATLASRRPIVLYIDDLQWSDTDSGELLSTLLSQVRRQRLLVVVSFRPAEATANSALTRYFEGAGDVERLGSLFDIEVGPLIQDEAEELTDSLLASSGIVDRPALSQAIVRESGRVPFFIEELARYSLAHSDAGDLEAFSLGQVLADRLARLPERERDLVETIAVADKPIAQSTALSAAGLDADALPRLLALRKSGMVSIGGVGPTARVAMYHDRIREAVVDNLSAAGRSRRHLELARTLVTAREDTERGPWIYDLVRHLGGAEPLMSDPVERLAAARWNLEAGTRARAAAAFGLAYACFADGRAFLPAEAWEEHYDLALALQTGCVEAAYLTAQWDEMEAGIGELKVRARDVLDQLPAWEVEIDASSGRQEYARAVQAAVEALALLGVELSPDPGMEEVGAAVERTMGVLGEVGTDGLLGLPDVSDPQVVAAMRIQVRTAPAAYFAAPMLLPILASNLVIASASHGLSTATPFALSLFGIVLNTMGLYPVAHQWGQVALRLLDRWEDRTLEACTRHVAQNLVCNFLIPLRDSLPAARNVFDIGRRTGDLEYAAYAAHVCSHNSFYAGLPLRDSLDLTLELGNAMEALGEVNAMHVHYPFEQLIRALLGLLPDAGRLDGPTFNEDEALRESVDTGSHAGQFIVYLTTGMIRLLMGDDAEASRRFELGRPLYGAAPSTWHQPLFHQYAAMAAYGSWETLSPEEREAIEPLLAEGRAVLEALAGHHPGNFAHRVTMVDAAAALAHGDRAGAANLFRNAADSAGPLWPNDVALAREWASRCLDGPGALAQLRLARDAYATWGATAKVKALEARIATG